MSSIFTVHFRSYQLFVILSSIIHEPDVTYLLYVCIDMMVKRSTNINILIENISGVTQKRLEIRLYD